MATGIYKHLVLPLLDRLDSETWHERVKHGLHTVEQVPLGPEFLEILAWKGRRVVDPRLKVSLAGVQLENPLIVGAGWDKSGISVRALYALGFASVEVGTVTPRPQPGNPRPRQFVLSSGVVINRLGFNNPGADVVAANLESYKSDNIPVGISIGKNKDDPEDRAPLAYAEVVRKLYPYGSYFVINVSSPNTPGLRSLQRKEALLSIAQAVLDVMDSYGARKPLLIKIAPELSYQEVDEILDVVLQLKLAGVVATNTVALGEVKARYGEGWRLQPGGLSGDDEVFRRMSTSKVAYIYSQTKGSIDIIGVGGVKDAHTALEKILAGATAVQVVTAIRSEGLAVAARTNLGLLEWLDKNGVKSISNAVGARYEDFLDTK